MATFSNGESGSSVRTKLNEIINKVEGTSLIGNDIKFGDNDKATFGAGSDLQIYHDGFNSYIDDAGTGYLVLKTSGTGVAIQSSVHGNLLIAQDTYTKLYNAGSEKLATTSTGVDVTGTVTADGLTVDGTTVLDSETNFVPDATSANKSLVLASQGATGGNGELGASVAFSRINTESPRAAIAAINTDSNFERMGLSFWTHPENFESVMKKRMVIGHEGDISFYEDTGTTPKFFWDASAERLGIGTSSPDAELHVEDATGNAVVQIESSATGFSAIFLGDVNDGDVGQIRYDHSDNSMRFGTNAFAERMRIDASGRVGIGTSSPNAATQLHVSAPQSGVAAGTGITISGWNGTSESRVQLMSFGIADGTFAIRTGTSNTERLRIDSSGNLLVGTTDTTPYNNNAGTAADQGFVVNDGRIFAATNASSVSILNRTSTDGTIQEFRKDGTTVGSVSVTASATAYNTSSDYRLKEDVQPMVGASGRVLALKPVNFAWKADGSRVDGFLAHEAQEVVPEAVHGTKDAVDADGNPVYQGIDQSKLVPLLTAALQEALQKIEALEARVTALEA